MVRLTPDQRPPDEPLQTPFVDLVKFLGKPGIAEILYHAGPAADGPIRFNQLQSSSGIPRNTLVNRLKEMVDAGFLERHQFDENPPRVEYEVTQKVVDLIPAFKELHGWCRENTLRPAEREGKEEEAEADA